MSQYVLSVLTEMCIESLLQVIDHLARSSLYSTIVDGNIDEKHDALEENCHVDISYESSVQDS